MFAVGDRVRIVEPRACYDYTRGKRSFEIEDRWPQKGQEFVVEDVATDYENDEEVVYCIALPRNTPLSLTRGYFIMAEKGLAKVE